MKYALIIQSPPTSAGAHSALRFATALLEAGHSIAQVFFYGDGAYLANQSNTPAQDEIDITSAWVTLLQDKNIPATVCIAAATTRGMLDNEEKTRYDKNAATIQPPFQLAGLGALVEATLQADRTVTFN